MVFLSFLEGLAWFLITLFSCVHVCKYVLGLEEDWEHGDMGWLCLLPKTDWLIAIKLGCFRRSFLVFCPK